MEKVKIGKGYYQGGYRRGYNPRPVVWLINNKAYVKDANGSPFQTDIEGYVMVNKFIGVEDDELFTAVGLISQHQIYTP